jgi:hypothetical protein
MIDLVLFKTRATVSFKDFQSKVVSQTLTVQVGLRLLTRQFSSAAPQEWRSSSPPLALHSMAQRRAAAGAHRRQEKVICGTTSKED